MSDTRQFWSWAVLILGAGAYVPLMIGGWQHPVEVNVAAYSLWLLLSLVFVYSFRDQGFAGWRMPLAFAVGNSSMLILGFVRGGYTFNLGSAEAVVLYGLIGTVCLWLVIGSTMGNWNSRILYWGGILVDILSFYPQLKQYLLPHEPPTVGLLVGWGLWVAIALINVFLVERLFTKLRLTKEQYEKVFAKTKNPFLILEESAFSLENGFFMIVTIFVMVRT
jgi:hypothetical protein